ncbi:MAG: CCA tRNA nucleotidyltransferase, partial [Candidatus Schekmanbacteria bacterium]
DFSVILDKEPYFQEKNVKRIIEERMTKEILSYFEIVRQIADEKSVNAYLVGGIVRDILLGIDNYDIDIVIEGNGVAFAKEFSKRVDGRIKTHGRFGTSSVFLSSGFRIDFATARAEFYESPAKLPVVFPGSLKRDLLRRDFSINALAVRLNGNPAYVLIDYFGGQRDLKDKVIRVLHSLSFVEDPTRIFRALRFETRLNFKIGKQTLALLKDSLSKGVMGRVSGKRILSEFILIFKEEKFRQILRRMEDLGVLKSISPYLKYDSYCEEILNKVEKVKDWYEIAFTERKIEALHLYLMGIFHKLDKDSLKVVSDRLSLPTAIRKKLRISIEAESIARKIEKAVKPSEIYSLLKDYDEELILFIMALTERRSVIKKIKEYLSTYKKVKSIITGNDLKNLGIEEGPIYSKILSEVHNAHIDGLVKTKEEEIKLARQLYKKLIGK